jgi:hypothetical protein
MSLNKPCNVCANVSMSNTFYFKELVKTDDGKGTYEDRFICGVCKSDINKRCIQAISNILPMALKENMIHKLKETYI